LDQGKDCDPNPTQTFIIYLLTEGDRQAHWALLDNLPTIDVAPAFTQSNERQSLEVHCH
jgi:hypothetical protein